MRAMAESMILGAVKDALAGDPLAERWLLDPDESEGWFDTAGVSHPRFGRLWKGSRDIALERYRNKQIQIRESN